VIEIDLSTAISQTLKNQWDIKIAQREVLKQEGVYQSSKGPFDPVFGARVKNDILYDTQQLGVKTTKDGSGQNVQLFLEKLTRLGTRYSITGELQRLRDPSLEYTSDYRRTNQYDLSFTIDQPLLKGLKYSQEAIDEKVSEIEVRALEKELILASERIMILS
jgi:hypothetical protein